MSTDDRIIELETKLAYLETQFEDLNNVVLEQATTIRHLKTKLSMTESKIEDLENGRGESETLSATEIAARDKPPHY